MPPVNAASSATVPEQSEPGDAAGPMVVNGIVRRKAGTIHVVGTAISDYGVFNVDVSL